MFMRMLAYAPVLALLDFTKPFVVITDAFDYGMGAVLLHEEHPITFESRKFIPAQSRYHTSEKEMLAVVHALRTWRCYLEGLHFTVISYHNPNTYLFTRQTLTRRQAPWSEFISSYEFESQYRPGKTNIADSLGRSPVGDPPTVDLNALMAIAKGFVQMEQLI